MPALSQQQQKIMGLALAYKRGNVSASEVSPTIKKIASGMSEKELEKYASTKHKGLPKKVGETKIKVEDLKRMVQDAVEEVMQERFNTKHLTPEQKQQFKEAVSNYNEYREIIHRSKTLPEAVSKITSIVEFANRNIVEESGDWFEGVSYNRKSKQIRESLKEFHKVSERIVKLQRRLESIYDGIGNHLGRFYEINQNNNLNDK
jgi:hypothetical protein